MIKKNKKKVELKRKVILTGPCPYKPIGGGLAIVNIEDMLRGFNERGIHRLGPPIICKR